MFNSISSILGSAWKMASQLTGNLNGAGDELETGNPTGAGDELEEKRPVVLAWDTLPLTPIAGQNVPRDVIQLIFSRLSLEDLFKVRMVSRLWHQIASTFLTLPRLFPEAPLINAQVWGKFVDLGKHELVFEKYQEPNITLRDYIEIKKIASEVEPNPRIYPIGFIDLPVGLTLNKLIAIGKAPKQGNKIPSESYFYGPVLTVYGDKPIKKTVRVLVTNGFFSKSIGEKVADQEKRVKDLKCDMPEVVPFMANIVLNFIGSESLYNFDQIFCYYRLNVSRSKGNYVYIRCVEVIENFKVVVGVGPTGGLVLDNGVRVGMGGNGVGGLRKFPGIGN